MVLMCSLAFCTRKAFRYCTVEVNEGKIKDYFLCGRCMNRCNVIYRRKIRLHERES